MDDQQHIIDEALRLLVDVMHGELDGRPTTVTERIRAAVYLYRWYIGGDLMPPEDEPEDPISAAIRETVDEQHDDAREDAKSAFVEQFWADPPELPASDDLTPCMLPS